MERNTNAYHQQSGQLWTEIQHTANTVLWHCHDVDLLDCLALTTTAKVATTCFSDLVSVDTLTF